MSGRLDAEVIVVGAGLAGLSAAGALRAAGVEVAVLEAAHEVGGRARTRPVGGAAANLGGEWIGARHRRMRALAARHGLAVELTRFLGHRVRWRTADLDRVGPIPPLAPGPGLALARAFGAAGRLARDLSAEAPWRSPGAAALDRVSFGSWLEGRGVTGDAYALMDTFVGDLVSMPIADLSLLHVLWWVRRNGGPIAAARSAFEARLAGGSQELARRMAAPLGARVRLGVAVVGVEQTAGAVRCLLDGGEEVEGRSAILALPATRLADIAFAPGLDPGNRRLAAELRIGAATKVLAALPAAPPGLPRAVLGGDALTAGWRYGRQITGFSRPPHDEQPDDVLVAELARAFGAAPGDLADVLVARWGREPRIGGCDVGFCPGQLTELGPLLGRRHGLVRFAGPERSTWPNNMEGAVESGERVAAETLRDVT